MLLTWLADTLREAGCVVVEMDGWERRQTRTGFEPMGIVWHHTATPQSASDASVDRILRDGRSDLSGPLSQLGLRRDGSFVVVAAGRANHNGYGTWGNDSIGIEAYNDGRGEPWPAVQMAAYARGTAAICKRMGWGIAQVRGHKETDPGRKIDPLFNMDQARAAVASYLEDDAMTPEQEQTLNAMAAAVQALHTGNWVDAQGRGNLEWLDKKLAPIEKRLATLETGGVDVDVLAGKVADLLADRLAD